MSRDSQVRLLSCGKLDAAKGGPSRATVGDTGHGTTRHGKRAMARVLFSATGTQALGPIGDSAGSHDPSIRVKASSELRLAVTRPVPAEGHRPVGAASDVRQPQ